MKKVFSILALAIMVVPSISSADMISNEKEFLREKYEASLRKCNDIADSGTRALCTSEYKNQYDIKRNLLEEDPDQYFDNKFGRKSPSSSGGGSGVPTVISGEWDNHGNRYTPSGGGNLLRGDGTLMQKTEGGYIDTNTGKFIPAK